MSTGTSQPIVIELNPSEKLFNTNVLARQGVEGLSQMAFLLRAAIEKNVYYHSINYSNYIPPHSFFCPELYK